MIMLREVASALTRRSASLASSLGLRPGAVIDLHGGRHPGRKDHALRHLIDVDAHRNALGKAYPGEDRIDRCKPLLIGLRVRDIDGARDAVDVATNDLAIAHRLDLGRVALVDRAEIDLLEIAVNPERVGVDEGDYILPDIRIVAELREQVSHKAVDGGADLSALEVDPRLVQVCQGLLILRLGGNRVRRIGLLVLYSDRQLGQLLPAL